MTTIPPEGDEYNKEREELLYANITNRTQLQRRYVEMVAAQASADQIAECTAAIVQTDKDIARLSLELHNSTQGRNLNIFLIRMDAALKENADANTAVLAAVNNNLTLITLTVEQVLAKSTKVEEAVLVLKQELGSQGRRHGRQIKALETDMAAIVSRLDRKRTELDEHTARIEALERDNARLVALEAAVERLAAGD